MNLPVVVALCHEPTWLSNVQANFERLPASVERHWLECREGEAAARNQALQWAREHDFNQLIFMDQDDWYGPGYAAQHLVALSKADFSGKPAARVRLADGVHTFKREWPFLGGTLAMNLENVLPFTQGLGTDHRWCAAMRAAGRTYLSTGPDEYIYQRRAGSVWQASDVQVRLAFGDSDLAPAPTFQEVQDDL